MRCTSTVGGWQTETARGFRFGPVFNSVNDLWKWQGSRVRIVLAYLVARFR
jgi:hypothetical protein